jgi:putative tricarboxylic transport membrane protein
LLLELFKLRENLPKLADVVFKGGGDAIQALLTGTVELSVGSLGAALPHIKAGTFRCLAICGDSRWPWFCSRRQKRRPPTSNGR